MFPVYNTGGTPTTRASVFTIIRPGASWRTGTSRSSRRHRAYSRHRRRKLNRRLSQRATALTTITTSQTTTFRAIFVVTIRRLNLLTVLLLTTSPWEGSQRTHRWLNSWRGSAISPEGHTGRRGNRTERELCPGEHRRGEYHRKAFSTR